MQSPAQQAGHAHQHAKGGGDQAQAIQPPQLGQRGDGQQRDRDGDQRVRQVELVIVEIQGVVVGQDSQSPSLRSFLCVKLTWVVSSCGLLR